MNRSKITVEWFFKVRDIASHTWDLCFRVPTEGRFWYETMESCGINDQFKFMYALVKRDGVPVAIAPAFFMNVPMNLVAPPWIMPILEAFGSVFPRLLFQPTLFVGSPCSDEGTVGVIPGENLRDLVVDIHAAVEQRAEEIDAQMIAWKDFPLEFESALLQLCKEPGLFPSLSYPGTIVHLSGKTTDEYFKSLKGTHRHNLKKKLKRSKQICNLSVQHLARPSSAEMSEIWSLFMQTYEKGKTKFEKLNPSFFELISLYQESTFILLRDVETQKLVSFMLCFKLGNRVINKFIGIDYSRPKEWNLYFRLWEEAVAWAIGQGATEFQSGQTGYRAKLDVGSDLVPLINYCRNRNPFFHELYRRVGPTISWSELDYDLAQYIKAHPSADVCVSFFGLRSVDGTKISQNFRAD